MDASRPMVTFDAQLALRTVVSVAVRAYNISLGQWAWVSGSICNDHVCDVDETISCGLL